MKRWLVAALVLLALLVLIAPGIVGRMAEQNIADNIEWAEDETQGVTIQTEEYERGWFTSEGRHRVVFEGGQFAEASEAYRDSTGNESLPSLVIDTTLAHGPLPGGSLLPGIASTVSTFHIDPGNGELIEIPGQLTSDVGLDGSSSSRLLLESSSFDNEGMRFEWEGADLDITSNPASGAVTVDGEVNPVRLAADGTTIGLGQISITADQARSDYGFTIGTVDMKMGEITVQDEASGFSIGGMAVTADSQVDDARLNVSSGFAMTSMMIPGVGAVDFDMDVDLNSMDAAAIGAISTALQDAQSSADPEAALAGVYPAIESDLQTLFNRGFSVNFEKLDVTLPAGVVATSFEMDVPESDSGSFDWGSVILNSTASLNMRIPSDVYDFAAAMSPQAGSLLAMGILAQDGDDYVIEAEYAQGLFSVNGAPMPIPIPGL